MSFDQVERSNFDAIPTALYEFRLGSQVWSYTSGDQAVTLFSGTANAQTFLPVVISDEGYSQSGDVTNDDFTVTMAKNLPVVDLFRGTPPAQEVYLKVRRKNLGEDEAPIIWVGTVKNIKIASAASAEALCKMLTSTLSRNGLRMPWGRGCPHALYDQNCKANKSAFAVVIQITSLTGTTITSTGLGLLAAGYLNGGFIEWNMLTDVMERRAIESNTGSTLTLLGPTDGLVAGQYVTVYPGCDRTTKTCDTKFTNLLNYGGFPHMPGKSPFDGDPVF